MARILICDDERDIVRALQIYLATAGFETVECYNAKDAIEVVKRGEADLVLMDVMMPEMDGISAMEEIRRISNLPIILLTAKSEDEDKINGLLAGADDYITKPFSPGVVIARINSNLRRYMTLGGNVKNDNRLRIGGVELDKASKSVFVDGVQVSVTPREYSILQFMMENAGTVFTPKEIYRKVWNEEPFGVENAIAVHVRHIREKIESDPAEPRYLKVVWGRGYLFEGGFDG